MRRNLPLIFILITLMIDAIGFGLIMPVMPDLLREVTGEGLAHAALWGGVLASAFAVMQFLFGPVLGNLSDRYGRKPVLLVSLGLLAVDYLVMALTTSILLLFWTRVIAGITAATQGTATAYIADITPPEDKAARFGLIGAAFGIGFVLGPAMGGVLAEFGTRAPFYAAGAMAALNMLFGWLVMRETVTDRIRRPFEWRRANPFGAFRALGRLPGVGRLLFIYFVYEFAFMVYPAVWAYFTIERFGWSPGLIGVSLASFGISFAIVQGGLIRVILRRLGTRKTIFAGLVFNILAFIVTASLQSGALALIFIPLTALGGVVMPAIQGVLSVAVEDNQQGELQGAISSIRAVAMIGSPLVMTQAFAYFTRSDALFYLPGAPFIVSAALMALCVFLFRRETAVGTLLRN
jgi:DHA1 family tetracycline resistance protein-like MFS transporter